MIQRHILNKAGQIVGVTGGGVIPKDQQHKWEDYAHANQHCICKACGLIIWVLDIHDQVCKKSKGYSRDN